MKKSFYNTYLQTIVDTAVQSDIYKFYTYQQFLDNITLNPQVNNLVF